MSEFSLKYGKKEIKFKLDKKNVLGVLDLPESRKKVKNLTSSIKKALRRPIGCVSLIELLRKTKPKNPVLILEDITRPNPDYPLIISTVISELKLAGIKKVKFVIAYGTHRRQTEEENIKLYGNIQKFGEIIHHNCDDKNFLVSIGKLSTGTELVINKAVAESDFVISLGNIEPHSFAGYGGGRKSILPGVSSRETITRNHSKVVLPGVGMGIIENNPIHLEMLEAAELLAKTRPFFILNFIRNTKKEILKIVAGDHKNAFFEGVKFAEKIYKIPVKKESDVVIVSSGGYPKDLNLYQAQKSISATHSIVKKGGTIILIAECSDGIGQPIFERWLKNYSLEEVVQKKENEIEVEGHRAYLTAKILSKCDVLVISSIRAEKIKQLKFQSAEDIQSAIEIVRRKYGSYFSSYIVPNGSAVLPILRNN